MNSPLLSHRSTRIYRRAVDLLMAAVMLPFALPVCLVLMVVVRLDSEGPPLFFQTRVGRGERPFKMMKLRTMRRNTGDLPSHMVSEQYITRVGSFLRRTKLDELPQLVHVLAGSMSLIGPRPCLPTQLELITERRARGLFALRPGLTGPAQLAGVDMSQPLALAAIEAEYFRSAGILDDLALLSATFMGKGAGDPAYRERADANMPGEAGPPLDSREQR